MNPHLDELQPYPFEKLRKLFDGITPPAGLAPIRLSIGEPQHATPAFIRQSLIDNLGGLANYPTTQGSDALRQSIASWLERRFGLPAVSPATQVLPVNGSREALFAFAQCVIDGARPDALVLCPNPFYQIYEGAAYLAGAKPYFVNNLPDDRFAVALHPAADGSGCHRGTRRQPGRVRRRSGRGCRRVVRRNG